MAMNPMDRALLAHVTVELYNREVKAPDTPAAEE
jgi:hypothetical protein